MPSFLGRACAKCMRMIKLEKKCPSPHGRAQGLRVSVSSVQPISAFDHLDFLTVLGTADWHHLPAPFSTFASHDLFYPRLCLCTHAFAVSLPHLAYRALSSVLIFSSPPIYPGFYISVVHTWFCLPPAWLPMAWPVTSPCTSLVKLETARPLWPLLLSSCSVLNERFQPHSIVCPRPRLCQLPA